MFEKLTCLLPQFSGDQPFGVLVRDEKGEGTANDPITMPWIDYGEAVNTLWEAIYEFAEGHPELDLYKYDVILEKNNLAWDWKSMTEADVSKLDGQAVMALLMGATRAERFCDGVFLDFCEAGHIKRWLKRLKEIDAG